jgi:hypothetical protein
LVIANNGHHSDWSKQINQLDRRIKPRMKTIGVLLLSLISIFNAFADINDDISNAIRSGDAKVVATYFNTTIDLTLISQEDVYSKTQGEQLLKDFFTKNPPKSFSLDHKGSSREGTLFSIGTFVSSNGKTFRVSFTLKMLQGRYTIQELRFELK